MRNFKYLLLATALFLGACGNGDENQGEENGTAESKAPTSQITIKGSDTQLPLTQKEAEEYMKVHPEASISVVGGGSGVGISALLDGNTDIAMSSRDLKTEEKLKLQSKNVQEVTTAYDALAVVVNPNNPISQLTREQLEDIYTGKVTNWKEVGGNDEKIVVYSRESSSGTYEFFKEHVMGKKNYASTVLNMTATGGIIQAVKQTPGAIGYVGLAYVKPDAGVKALKVSYDGGATYVEPSLETAKDKTYPVSRPLYFFYTKDKEVLVKPFVDFVLSAEGQKVVEEVGYIPVQ